MYNFPSIIGNGTLETANSHHVSQFRDVFGYINQPPTPIVPTVYFDKGPGINDLLENRLYGQSRQDVVRMIIDADRRAEESQEIILEKMIPAGKKFGAYYCDNHFYYQLEDGILGQHYIPKNFWMTSGYSVQGQGIYSFTQYVTGLSYLGAYRETIHSLGINSFRVDYPQPKGGKDDIFIDNQFHYTPSDSLCPNPTIFLGVPHAQYQFFNDYGQIGFYLHEWKLEKESIWLFYSLHYNQKKRQVFWDYLAPPAEKLLYNKYLLTRHKDFDIHIHDDIANVRPGIHDGIIDTWAGDLSMVEHLPWDCLKGTTGKIRYLFCEVSNESVEIGSKLKEIFEGMGMHLEWVTLDESHII